jgi:histidyl-tRNA synthetase
MGGESLPAVGFGFGDAVIVELLKMKNKLPNTEKSDVQVMVFAMEEALRAQAVAAAAQLRAAGLRVDLVLEAKKNKWVFQRADKTGCRK